MSILYSVLAKIGSFEKWSMVLVIHLLTVQSFASSEIGETDKMENCAELVSTTAPSAVDPLTTFLNRMGRFPMIADDEWPILISRRDNGDIAAINEIVERNLRLLVSVAKKNRSSGYTLLQTIQMGSLGLRNAAASYDPSIAAFSTYATTAIQRAIMEARRKDQAFKVPREIAKRVKSYRDYIKGLEHQVPAPSDAEVANELGFTFVELAEVKEVMAVRAVPLEQPSGEGSDETYFLPDQAGVVVDDSSFLHDLDESNSKRDQIVLSVFELGPTMARLAVKNFVLNHEGASGLAEVNSVLRDNENFVRLMRILFAGTDNTGKIFNFITSGSSKSDLEFNFNADTTKFKRKINRSELFEPIGRHEIQHYYQLIERIKTVAASATNLKGDSERKQAEVDLLNRTLERLPQFTRAILSGVYGAVVQRQSLPLEIRNLPENGLKNILKGVADTNGITLPNLYYEFRRGLFAIESFVHNL